MSSMRINAHILSIPPYISTSWTNIASLHVEQQGSQLMLIISLHNGTLIEIPHLEGPVLETIFSMHAKFLESEQPGAQSDLFPHLSSSNRENSQQLVSIEIPLKTGLDKDHLGDILQHNPDQADAPDLPQGLIYKIAHLTSSIGIDDPEALPQPESDCNCMYCQIARAMQSGILNETPEQKVSLTEEIVSDEDLKFRSWEITQKDRQLFHVSNPIDVQEQYTVFLGDPIGCTCGEKHCEHVRAVLYS